MDSDNSQVYLPGTEKTEDDETNELEFDSSAYKLYHEAQTEQKKTKDSDDEESSSDDESDDPMLDRTPTLTSVQIQHHGAVNRLRTTRVCDKTLLATWSDAHKVHVWDATSAQAALDDAQLLNEFESGSALKQKPLQTFGYTDEGFALAWSPLVPGRLATGDCKKNIFIWEPLEGGGSWRIDQRPLVSHKSSVEDIAWSPSEPTVFASCSVDKSIKIWDTRAPPADACQLTNGRCHERDINVISWNAQEPFIVSGGDDAYLKVWDLRQFRALAQPIAVFKHHSRPITSVEWCPSDSSVFAASGEDDQLTIWDLAVERDTGGDGGDAKSTKPSEPDVPPQLLFIHQGQKEIKELHWHYQLPGVIVSTALTGLNVFRTISV